MDKSVVVTGVGSGIGRAILKKLVAENYFVVGIESNVDSASSAAAEFKGHSLIINEDICKKEVLVKAATEAKKLPH